MTLKRTTNDDTMIHSRALLVWLTISTWSARRYDRAVSNKVNADYSASTDAGRYNKFLLPGDAPSYKELVTLTSSLRAQHYAHTLAWSDEGWRLLPTANYMDYTKWFREQQTAFNRALDQFARDYPDLRDRASVKLGKLFKSEDYPSVADLRERFSLDVKYSPLPSFGDIRVDLAADQIATIEASVNQNIVDATAIAMRDAWQRLYDVVAHVSERLTDPKAVFRDSLINNAREICDTLSRLNVTNDPQLEQMRQRVSNDLTAFDPDVLRDTPAVRARVASKADDILNAMRGVLGSAA
jgi:hypothetical protein